jgi:ribosomal 30S subunit maturation factor RimM
MMLLDAATGAEVGEVTEVFELPQGLLLEFRGAQGTHAVPFVEEFIDEVDREGRRIRVRLPDGLLEL